MCQVSDWKQIPLVSLLNINGQYRLALHEIGSLLKNQSVLFVLSLERILSCDRTYFSSAICMMRLTLLLLWSIMSGTRSTTTIEVSRPKAFGSSIPILLIRA